MRAAILAVGTEVTSGQIHNGNAGWLAERLTDLGFDVVRHEAVPDDGPAILQAMHECSTGAEVLLVTGGLGPTRDDFTRDWVARWLGVPLEYHAESWDHLSRRLEAAGIRVAESNRQQCFFPRGAEVLTNPAGTANGFGGWNPGSGTHYWILPGPPRELGAIWKDSLEAKLRELLPQSIRRKLLTWQCLGKSEAELGEIVEQAVSGSGLETGYRAHRPYIEIKLWVPEEESSPRVAVHQAAIDRLEIAIQPWVVGRGTHDLIDACLSRFSHQKLLILDEGTEGILFERIMGRTRELGFKARAPGESAIPALALPEVRGASGGLSADWPGAWVLRVRGAWLDPEWRFLLDSPAGATFEGVARSPWKMDPSRAAGVQGLRDRVLRWAVEAAMKWCVDLDVPLPR